MRTKRTPRGRRRGLRVVGPGFYLWEADAGEALRFAADLRRRPPPPASRPRSRLVPDPLG